MLSSPFFDNITITASNAGGTVNDTHTIVISAPPTPTYVTLSGEMFQ